MFDFALFFESFVIFHEFDSFHFILKRNSRVLTLYCNVHAQMTSKEIFNSMYVFNRILTTVHSRSAGTHWIFQSKLSLHRPATGSSCVHKTPVGKYIRRRTINHCNSKPLITAHLRDFFGKSAVKQ